MALTTYQRTICRLLAEQRIARGESYVAGGAALCEATASNRLSQDIDLFHDSREAVSTGWEADRALLQESGYVLEPIRERPSFVEAVVARGGERVLVQWAADSAFRFFPLVEHPDFGLTLHPFDLATNKVLALVGRVEARDWVDVIAAHEQIQEIGYLAWAACGKDPGFSPASILDQAGRTARYSNQEVDSLAFAGSRPSASELSQAWHAMLAQARELTAALPREQAGTCVLDHRGTLFRGGLAQLQAALGRGAIRFRAGSLRGVLPTIHDA
jgi:hypothetical protein